jgi:hypothetical protein
MIIERKPEATAGTLTLASDGTSPDMAMARWASCGFVVKSVSGAATFTFYVARATLDSKGNASPGTYGQIMDSTNTAVSQTITNGKGYTFPEQCFPFAFIKIYTDAGTATIEPSKKS